MPSPRPLEEAEGSSVSSRPTKMPRLDKTSSSPSIVKRSPTTRKSTPSRSKSGQEEKNDGVTYTVVSVQSSARSRSVTPGSPTPLPPLQIYQSAPAIMTDVDSSTVQNTQEADVLGESDLDLSDRDRESSPPMVQTAIDMLEEELTCGMCAGLYIDPVVLDGCGHSFCGSCVQSWIKSMPPVASSSFAGDPPPKPIVCPHCRYAPILEARPSRLARAMVEILLKQRPEAVRSDREKEQARQIYSTNMGVLKFPTPPARSRAPEADYWQPCRSCYSAEENSWKCPIPVPRRDVAEERDMCLRKDGLCPDGHRMCSSCSNLCPSNGPRSVNCGICGEGFCGDDRKHSCSCTTLSDAKLPPHWTPLHIALEEGTSDLVLIAFKDNWIELDHLAAYLANLPPDQRLSPETILASITSAPDDAQQGVSTTETSSIPAQILPSPAQATVGGNIMQSLRVCGGCVEEMFCSGIFEWWLKELKKPEVQARLPKQVRERPNCRDGRNCSRQYQNNHAKHFNHVCEPLPAGEGGDQQDPPSNGPNGSGNSDASGSNASQSSIHTDSDSEDHPVSSKATYVDVGVQCAPATVVAQSTAEDNIVTDQPRVPT